MNPWQERYAYYWYTDKQIFRYTDADFDRDAAEYAKNGVTTILTFSNTHFRWDFRPWWPQLGEVLKAVTGGTRLNLDTKADLLASVHKTQDGLTLHLFNLEGTIPDHALLAENSDPIETFDCVYKLACPVTVRYAKPEGLTVRSVTVSTPEGAENLPLDFTDDGKTVAFTVPAGIFGGYALIEARS